MALTEIQKAQVDKLLTAYCAKRVSAPGQALALLALGPLSTSLSSMRLTSSL